MCSPSKLITEFFRQIAECVGPGIQGPAASLAGRQWRAGGPAGGWRVGCKAGWTCHSWPPSGQVAGGLPEHYLQPSLFAIFSISKSVYESNRFLPFRQQPKALHICRR